MCKGKFPTRKLLCSWHVDRAWRKSLNELIPVQTERVTIYHHLRTVLQCGTISAFRVLLQNFISWLMESEYDDFCCYFQSTYCKRVEEWAFCYRVGTPFNTNMFVESFHRLLKIVYLDGKQNRRIDRLLNILLRIARDKAYERLIKIEKGKTTHRVCEINKRHQAAKTLLQKKKYELPTQEIDEHNITFWKVQGSDMKNEYTVVKLKNSCDCKIRCTPCNTCIHMFRCTCIDDLIHGTICKHIHIVQIVQDRNKGEKEMSLPENNDGILYGSDYFLEILGTEKQNAKQDNQKLIDVKEKMDKMIKQLQTMNQTCTNTDAITSSMVHVKAAIAIIQSSTNEKGMLQM